MAKDKKRGFFSWLGFGRDETSAAQDEQKETLEEQQPAAENASDAATLTPPEAELHTPEQVAEEIVAVTETVAEETRSAVLPAEKPAQPAVIVEAEEPAQPVVIAEAEEPVQPEAIAEAEEWLPEDEPLQVAEPEAEPEQAVAQVIEPEIAPDVVEPEWVTEPEPVVIKDAVVVIDEEAIAEAEEITPIPALVEQERPTKEGFFARLKRSLVKTRQNLGSGFIGLFRGKKIDDDLFEELEEQLLIADVGVDTTRRIIASLTQQADRKQLRDAEALYGLLKTEMSQILAKVEAPLDVSGKTPFVILMVGVNGVGKTTTIGKLARQYQAEGKSVMLAAGDTFRAAAVEQLQVWGQRNNIPVIAQQTGADSASVIFDAIQAAKARGADVLIADTAGRLQNKAHLMEELKKITRVMKKLDDAAPHEVMLTIDASTGQNAISQTKLFHEAVGLTGITLTKLDGTAKGGVIFSVADQFSIPIRYIGVGEGIEDLRSFKADDFIEALFARED
ncbi:signal recognition particle-docking protein FtsY [Erwiniaceae bacterium BAC15a-03b]|uniref:Signal recognition particle receptor FtsY n=1 Tax=Winslowiella arboricola TaxID=2978220 RepID=A0A9J6PGW6_9GAMM|nr:signal recognition particle-docking protein FtsY [Winslowiella arboricola]MCU5771238.1 signal recognition particle-docking protein FtsY [Winslowiella arboricola]MCU5777545.1 signal recognition particle-docking protein FtsY [Winslowiella arboricola]